MVSYANFVSVSSALWLEYRKKHDLVKSGCPFCLMYSLLVAVVENYGLT